jgi:hypothetical protein
MMPETAPPHTREGGNRQGPASGDWLLIAGCGAALWLVNGVWLIRDTRPPVWDMAVHQAYALNYVPGFTAPDGLKAWQLSGNYPPLVHRSRILAVPSQPRCRRASESSRNLLASVVRLRVGKVLRVISRGEVGLRSDAADPLLDLDVA